MNVFFFEEKNFRKRGRVLMDSLLSALFKKKTISHQLQRFTTPPLLLLLLLYTNQFSNLFIYFLNFNTNTGSENYSKC
jgi:hypothetical protein